MPLSSLERLKHLTFENFRVEGNPQSAHAISALERESLEFAKSDLLRNSPSGWKAGCSLEAPTAAARRIWPLPLRTAQQRAACLPCSSPSPTCWTACALPYNSPETTFEQRVRGHPQRQPAGDGRLRTQNATGWAQEKLFQIVNYRYINKLPTVSNHQPDSGRNRKPHPLPPARRDAGEATCGL